MKTVGHGLRKKKPQTFKRPVSLTCWSRKQNPFKVALNLFHCLLSSSFLLHLYVITLQLRDHFGSCCFLSALLHFVLDFNVKFSPEMMRCCWLLFAQPHTVLFRYIL